MTNHPLYNIRRGPHGFQLGKFDHDLNLLAVYDTDAKHCTCPAGPRPTCKHRKMLPRMLARVDTDEFYCYETQTWSRPLAQMADEYNGASEQPVEPTTPAILAQVEAATPQPTPPPPTSGIRRR